MVIAKTIHIIESEDNPVTICTGEPYDRPKILEGVLVSFCSVCRLTLRGRMTAQYKLDHPKATVEEIASALGRAEIAWDEEFKAEHPW